VQSACDGSSGFHALYSALFMQLKRAADIMIATLKVILVYLAITAAILLFGIWSMKYWGEDNPYEEVVEELIEGQTGMKVDLSPNTPE